MCYNSGQMANYVNRSVRPRLGAPILVIGILTMAAILSACSPKGYSGPVESVNIGTTASEVNSLILIAHEQGYFINNGLNVTRKIYPSGVAALEGMSNHEIDMVTGSEFAFVGDVLSGKDIHTIGAISRSLGEYLVGRVDRGISSVTDLKGKIIGVPIGSRPEFALDRFLLFRGIEPSGVTRVNVPVNKSVDALVNGEVDAVAAWQPYIDRIKEQMGDGVVIWEVHEDQPSYTIIMCTEEWTTNNPELVERFLKSLVQAEDYITGNPEKAKAFIQQKLNYDDAYMASVWTDYHFSVTLDQALIVAMEDQTRWIIDKNLTGEKQTPNFVKYIYVGGLEAVKPEAVNIIK